MKFFILFLFSIFLQSNSFALEESFEFSSLDNDCYKCYAEDSTGEEWYGKGRTRSSAKSEAYSDCRYYSDVPNSCRTTVCSVRRRRC